MLVEGLASAGIAGQEAAGLIRAARGIALDGEFQQSDEYRCRQLRVPIGRNFELLDRRV